MNDDEPAFISMDNVGYSYSGAARPALSALSLSIRSGERIALMGPNGAGKSTLLQLMAGLLAPSRGVVRWRGQRLPRRPMPLHAGIGLLFQNPDDQLVLPQVGEDVALGPRNLGLTEDEVQARVREALARVGLDGFDDRLSHTLSRGEKQRAALAGVLATNPRVLLLDEPTASLDPAGRRSLLELLATLASGTTLVIATHDAGAAARLAQRVVVLDRRLLGQGAAAHIFADGELLARARLEPPPAIRLWMELGGAEHSEAGPLTHEELLPRIRLRRPKG